MGKKRAPKPPTATITVPVPIIVPRGKHLPTLLQQDLYTTRREFNSAVANWQEVLWEIRQEDVYFTDGVVVTTDEWRQRLQERRQEPLSEEDYADYKKLYKLLIPSYQRKEKKKNKKKTITEAQGQTLARQATSNFGILTNKNSTNGENAAKILCYFDNFPAKCMSQDEAEKLAKEKDCKEEDIERVPTELLPWITSVLQANAVDIFSLKGAPLPWVKELKEVNKWKTVLVRKGSLVYDLSEMKVTQQVAEKLLRKVENEQEKAKDPFLLTMKKRGLLPLTPDYFATRLIPTSSNRAVWGTMALAQAAANLNSWESRRHTLHDEYEEYTKTVNKLEKHGKSFWEDAMFLLKRFEHLTKRTTRGWDILRTYLEEHPQATEKQRLDYLNKQLRRRRSKFGDGALLQKLFSDEYIPLTASPKGDIVSWCVDYSSALYKKETAKLFPETSFANGSRNPPYGKSQLPYKLVMDEKNKHLYAEVVLLTEVGNGKIESVKGRVRLGTHKSLRKLKLKGTKQNAQSIIRQAPDKIKDDDGNIQKEEWQVGGSLLNISGDIRGNSGSANLHLILKRPLPKDEDGLRIYRPIYFNSGLETRAKKELEKWKYGLLEWQEKGIPCGTTAMGLDLGSSETGAYSIFVYTPRGAKHCRSGLIVLPGDNPTEKQLYNRDHAFQRIRDVEYHFKHMKDICRNVEDGEEEISSFLEAEDAAFRALVTYQREVKKDREWLQNSTLPRLGYLDCGWGMSYAYIQFLEKQRKLQLSWDNRHRPNRDPQKGTRGSVAKKKLAHINNVKTERARQTAHRIDQIARGLVRKNGEWLQKYEPVDLLINDGLRKYRTSKKNSPKSNHMLMTWCHREITRYLKQYPLKTGRLPAQEFHTVSYSSKFHARTGAPGFRASVVTKRHLHYLQQYQEISAQKADEESWEKLSDKIQYDYQGFLNAWKWLPNALTAMGMPEDTWDQLQPGDLVKTDGGKVFVTLVDGKVHQLNANINAAQNMTFAHLNGYNQPYAIYVAKTNSEEVILDASKSLLKGAFEKAIVIFDPVWEKTYKKQPKAYNTLTEELKKRFTLTTKDARDIAQLNVEDEENDGEEGDITDFFATLKKNKKALTLCHDYSGLFFRDDFWVESGKFWGYANQKILKQMKIHQWNIKTSAAVA